MKGIINVYKPLGITSHDTVRIARNILGIKKIGHLGTLDPYAVGVLPICVGKATRLTEFLVKKDKTYLTELTLGVSTDSHDSQGKIIKKNKVNLSFTRIKNAIKSFQGETYQEPPMVSAIKYKGQRLYRLASKGITINREKRYINVYYIKIIDFKKPNKITFEVSCSSGTYIRTLCKDIGEFLGCGGHMSYLIRTKVDQIKLCDSYSLTELKNMNKNNQVDHCIIPADELLNDVKCLYFNDEEINKFKNGQIIDIKSVKFSKNEMLKIYSNNDLKSFIGIGITNSINKNIVSIKPKKVFI